MKSSIVSDEDREKGFNRVGERKDGFREEERLEVVRSLKCFFYS